MNKVILMGSLTRDPEVRYTQGDNSMAIARYTLAVDRRFKKEGEATADFISCVAFGKAGEFAEILPAGLKGNRLRPDPDRELHQPGREERFTQQML